MSDEQVKPGIRTSEFWLSIIAVIALNASAVYAESQWAPLAAIIGNALIAAGYGYARVQAKKVV